MIVTCEISETRQPWKRDDQPTVCMFRTCVELHEYLHVWSEFHVHVQLQPEVREANHAYTIYQTTTYNMIYRTLGWSDSPPTRFLLRLLGSKNSIEAFIIISKNDKACFFFTNVCTKTLSIASSCYTVWQFIVGMKGVACLSLSTSLSFITMQINHNLIIL